MNSSQKQKEMMIDKQNDDLELQAMPQPPPDMEKKATEWHDSPQTSMSDMMDDSPTSSTNAAVRPKSTKKGDNDEEEDLNSNKNKGTKEQEDATEPPEQPQRTCVQAIKHSYFQNQFLIHLLIAICVARAYPTLGVKYVAPKITAGWIAVAIIFCKYLH